MSANCSGVLGRPSVVTGSVSSVPAGPAPPQPPGRAGDVLLARPPPSLVVMPSCAMRSGRLDQHRELEAAEGQRRCRSRASLDLVLDVQLL
jgi:hypothetical protein